MIQKQQSGHELSKQTELIGANTENAAEQMHSATDPRCAEQDAGDFGLNESEPLD